VGFRLHIPGVGLDDVCDMTVCFAMATLYLQELDERRGGNHLVVMDGDPAGGEDGTSDAVLARSLEGKTRSG